MKIKKFNELNENLGYKSFFDKEVSHEQALQERIKSLVSNIIMDEREISEKSFKQIDSITEEVNNIFNEHNYIYEEAQKRYDMGKRLQWLAEEIYDDLFKN